jgi:two-component system CheB/CheR fusion protein
LGIGLTLVSRLVAMHGGSVEARSGGQGQGSELLVRLPLAEAPRVDEARAAAEDRKAPPAQPLRILVVDDNRDAADSLALLLGLQGHEVRTCYDGLAAVEGVRSFRPDVALLDIGLPGLSGHEAARRIRADETGRTTTLVAITGWGQEEDRRRSASAGFDHHITKPVQLKEINALLAAVPR